MRRNEFLDWLQHQLQENNVAARRYQVEDGLEDLEVAPSGATVRLRIVGTPAANQQDPDREPVHRAPGTPIEHRRMSPEAEHAFYASPNGQEPAGPPVRRQRRTSS